jgi:hypothetical protein
MMSSLDFLSSTFDYLARLIVTFPGYWIVRVHFSSLFFQRANPIPSLIFSPLSFILNLLSPYCFDN